MINWLLGELEKGPTRFFREKALIDKSEEQFMELQSQGYFEYCQPSSYETYPCNIPCSEACSMDIVEYEGKSYAICPNDTEIDRIPLSKENITRWSFNIQRFIEKIKQENGLVKPSCKITSRVYFVGERYILQNRVAVLLAFVSNDKHAEIELLPIRFKIDKVDNVLILCPSYEIESQELRNMLAGQDIKCMTFNEIFSNKSYSIDYSKITFKQEDGSNIPKLDKKQLDDYNEYDYKCYDVIHIPGTVPLKRSNDLIVNGNKIKMPDKSFKLFMKLVIELKKGKGGWLYRKTESGGYHIWDHLKKPIAGSLLKKDVSSFTVIVACWFLTGVSGIILKSTIAILTLLILFADNIALCALIFP